jgi:hypothetical protein
MAKCTKLKTNRSFHQKLLSVAICILNKKELKKVAEKNFGLGNSQFFRYEPQVVLLSRVARFFLVQHT